MKTNIELVDHSLAGVKEIAATVVGESPPPAGKTHTQMSIDQMIGHQHARITQLQKQIKNIKESIAKRKKVIKSLETARNLSN